MIALIYFLFRYKEAGLVDRFLYSKILIFGIVLNIDPFVLVGLIVDVLGSCLVK